MSMNLQWYIYSFTLLNTYTVCNTFISNDNKFLLKNSIKKIYLKKNCYININ